MANDRKVGQWLVVAFLSGLECLKIVDKSAIAAFPALNGVNVENSFLHAPMPTAGYDASAHSPEPDN